MGLFDIILLIIIAGFGMFGFWFGLIHTLGSLLGTIFGVYLATRYYGPMADWLIGVTGWGDNFSKVLMFIIAFVVINRLVGFVFWIIEKTTNVITYLPFIRGINRFLGLIFGLLEGLISLGIVFYFIERIPLSERFMGWMAGSVVVPYTVSIAAILLPFVPEALKLLRSSVDYMEDVLADNL